MSSLAPRVVSVNVGMPKAVPYETTSLPTTGIEKQPVDGPVRISLAGVEGNGVGDTHNHGDEFMRVYAYSVEDYSWWQAQLGRTLAPGHFAEQLTTEGIDLNAALVGEIWRVGTARLQIAHVRTPCLTFKGWMGHSGYDATAWVKRFALAGRGARPVLPGARGGGGAGRRRDRGGGTSRPRAERRGAVRRGDDPAAAVAQGARRTGPEAVDLRAGRGRRAQDVGPAEQGGCRRLVWVH
ncbi:hypothetical protein ABIE44_003261 [Marmoricola sp. OAE513]|uniref:MOSC domain-containing protein n=1 Tax=Marmoricola sp. OAE513 TaxID=2817894 RepID=UPI00339ABBDC